MQSIGVGKSAAGYDGPAKNCSDNPFSAPEANLGEAIWGSSAFRGNTGKERRAISLPSGVQPYRGEVMRNPRTLLIDASPPLSSVG